MKKITFLLVAFLVFFGCTPELPIEEPDQIISAPVLPSMFDGLVSSVRYLRVHEARGIADNDPLASICNTVGDVYMFYHDSSVVEYTPIEGAYNILKQAASVTVESHNIDFPNLQWDFIAIDPPIITPDLSNDPILEKWQVAFVLESGQIMRLYQAESLEQFIGWDTSRSICNVLESWNQDNDPDAHAVWGPKE